MSRSDTVEFTKMHGAGNDFLVLDNRRYRLVDEELTSFAATWCRRRYGVGADGLLALEDADGTADYRMRYVNADGSWATMCGNGARCLARFALRSGIRGPEVAFETDIGRYHALVLEGEKAVRLYVPDPIELDLDTDLATPLPDGLNGVHYIHTGTEHLVAFVPEVEDVPLDAWGPRLRRDAAVQPAGANANFVECASDGLRVRTYEKGVEAETPSCGTGVLAAAAVADLTGRAAADRLRVTTPGGCLHVGRQQTERGQEQYLEGPVAHVFRGALAVE